MNQAVFQNNSVELVNMSQVYDSLRYSEYLVENGIGELADNSIQAGAHHLNIDVSSCKGLLEGKKKEVEKVDRVFIADDGIGMGRDVLHKSLVLGLSQREDHNGIGRFGVGMILGSISIAKRVEVYSRNSSKDPFLYTYIDLDEIADKSMERIPEPIENELPERYEQFFRGKTGTLVVLSNCDRAKEEYSVTNSKIANYLGRTYRKFIEAGTEIKFNGNKVFLHDPLYVSGPTRFDSKESMDPKAVVIDTCVLPLEIPGKGGETADIKITISLLPREWRMTQGSGGNADAKLRHIDQNEGISILRADREVFYDKVPYLIGKKGQAAYKELDRWWGCEISFPPELDDYFQVRYIKRGAEPVGPLKDKLNSLMTPVILGLRKTIQADWALNEHEKNSDAGEFGNVEKAVSKAQSSMMRSLRGKDLSEEEEDKKIEDIVETVVPQKDNQEEREQEKAEKKEKIKRQPLSLETVAYPASILFEPDYLMSKIVIKINVKHPFYEKFIKPLCGDLESDSAEISNEKMLMRDAIYLLFCSYAKATSMFETDAEEVLSNHLEMMGTMLGTLVKNYEGGYSND